MKRLKSIKTNFKNFIAIVMMALLILLRSPIAYAQTTPPEAPSAPTPPPEPESPPEPDQPPEAPTAPDAEEMTISDNLTDEEKDVNVTDEGSNDNDVNNGEEPVDGEQLSSSSEPEPQFTTLSEESGGVAGDNKVGDTTIDTGDATNGASITTSANSNLSGIVSDPEATSGGIQVVNEGNGTSSDNSGSVSLANEGTTLQTNGAKVANNLNEVTETGDNSASRNVGDSQITTGDANTTGTVITAVNTNIDGVQVNEFNIVDDQVGDVVLDFGQSCVFGCATGDLSAENLNNGSDSTNDAEIDSSVSSYTFQTNDALVENNMTLSSDSGNNNTDRNTAGDSTIETGDANVSANSLTFANNNLSGGVVYSVVNIFGDLIGDIIFPDGFCCTGDLSAANVGNGTNSENLANIDVTNSDTQLQANDADIQNYIVLDANTGDNTTSDNTGGTSSITTGDASAEMQLVNIANTNIAGGDWWLVIVNEAGNWVGKILGAPLGALYGGSDGFLFTQADSGEITVTNSENGSDSQNTGSVSKDSTNTTVQANDAQIVNNINLSANTGGNSASRNTGGTSSITTGDADIIANLVNFVNNNIAGGKLFVTVVNVFGSWMGDFVSPGSTKEADSQNENSIGGASNQESNNTSQDNSSNSNGSSAGSNQTSGSGGQSSVASLKTNGFSSPSILGVLVNAYTSGNDSEEGNTAFATQNEEGVQTKGNVVRINLAWLLPLIPILLVYVGFKKRKFIIAHLPSKVR